MASVSVKRRLRTLFCCGILQFGALFGVPMRPEQIQELMRSLNEAKVARTAPEEAHRGDKSRPSHPTLKGR
jgi:hypothetical protein